MAPPPPCSPTAHGITLTVRLTPRAGRAAIEGWRATPQGEALAVAVNEPPEDGKANAALAALLAKQFHVAKSAVHIDHGAKSRNKTVTVDGDPKALVNRLTQLLNRDNVP